MIECPWAALRRLPPDPVQLQVIVGSLLGDGHIVGAPGARRLHVHHALERAAYVRWKYERLGAFAQGSPYASGDGVALLTITHPVFDDLARMRPAKLLDLLSPLGLAVWLCDVGRLQLRAESFLPAQRELALAGQATVASG